MRAVLRAFFGAFIVFSLAPPRVAGAERRTDDRQAALGALCERLGVGAGGVIADVGCGRGHDSFVFASIVGEKGTVFAEEISPEQLQKVLAGAKERGLRQVVPVLGQSSDPRLPDAWSDCIYLHFVFHHLADPRSMLANMWRDLKPGGYLVIIDRNRGPLRDPVPLETREREHHWTGETAVVRLAREAGFEFADALDEIWPEAEAFVLAFRRPVGIAEPGGEPNPALPIGPEALEALPLPREVGGDVAVLALEEARALLPAFKAKLPGARRYFDVILEEWVVEPGDAPAQACEGFEVLRTEKGDVALPEGTKLVVAAFADSYHRLWDPAALLARLRGALASGGRVIVIDRAGPEGEPRRLAGHRRRISPKLVAEDFERAGFSALGGPAEVAGRFVLCFGIREEAPLGSGEAERQF